MSKMPKPNAPAKATNTHGHTLANIAFASIASGPDAADVDSDPLISLPIPAGGVAIYDTRLRHRGGANRAGKPRSVFYVTVVGAGALPAGRARRFF